MAVSFIHTADFQIGKMFGNMPHEAGLLLRRQRIGTIRQIAQIATARNVEAVLVAGDVFDYDGVSNETLHAVLDAMRPFSGSWIMIPGNHDPAVAESVWGRWAAMGLTSNIHLATTGEIITVADGRLSILPAPLNRKHEAEDITAVWDALVTSSGAIRIGLAHGAVTGLSPAGKDACNPIATDREVRARLDYLALGDWHGTMQVSSRTWYSGSPEPDRFRTNDSGNVLHVTIGGPGDLPKVEKIHTGQVTWHELDHVLNGVEDLETLERKLKNLQEPHAQRVVAIELSGAIDFETTQRLQQFLERWRARFLHIDERFQELIKRPSTADLDHIDTGGFVRSALDRLVGMQDDPRNPERELAVSALEVLYRIHSGVESK